MDVKINGNNFFRITSGFQEKDYVHITPHTGIDMAMPIGTEVHSPISGEIVRTNIFDNNSCGKYVKLRSEDGDTDLIFCHLSEVKTQVGDHIDKGDLLALSGNTGHSTGPHLHLGAKDPTTGHFIDPSHWVELFQEISAEILGFITLFI